MKKGQEPAFPFNEEVFDRHGAKYNTTNAGMSKRFYAACAAMQGILANNSDSNTIWNYETIVKHAFMVADELLKQEDE